MTHPNDEKDPESALASLFDRTAKAPADEVRAKLGRHARDIGSGRPRSGPKAFGVWVPALAAAAALAYFAVPARHHAVHGGAASASASAVVAGGTSATTSAKPAPLAAPAEEATDLDDPAFAVLGGETGDVEPFDLGPLMGGPELRGRASTRNGRELGDIQRERSAP
jgi:hypothetical protein